MYQSNVVALETLCWLSQGKSALLLRKNSKRFALQLEQSLHSKALLHDVLDWIEV